MIEITFCKTYKLVAMIFMPLIICFFCSKASCGEIATDTLNIRLHDIEHIIEKGSYVAYYDEEKPGEKRKVFKKLIWKDKEFNAKSIEVIDRDALLYEFEVKPDTKKTLEETLDYFVNNDPDESIRFVSPVFKIKNTTETVSFRNEYFLKFTENTDENDMDKLLKKYQCEIVKYYPVIDVYLVRSSVKTFTKLVEQKERIEKEITVDRINFNMSGLQSILL
ncbi:MAG TPA: hypothetical protein PLN69_08105 [bacterium]|nr:hypothetical protein [bacterium]